MRRKGRKDGIGSIAQARIGQGGEATEEEPVPRERGDDPEGGGGAAHKGGEREEKKAGSEGKRDQSLGREGMISKEEEEPMTGKERGMRRRQAPKEG